MPEVHPGIEAPGFRRDAALPYLTAAVEPLPRQTDPGFARAFARFGDARVVLLGAMGDGALEFDQARAAVTRWLIENRGFNLLAFDADAEEVQALDEEVRGIRNRRHLNPLAADHPATAWRSAEVDALFGWLSDHNGRRPEVDQVRLCGLDVYGRSAAMRLALAFLDRVSPQSGAIARSRMWGPRPWAPIDTLPAASGDYARCEGAVTAMLVDALGRRLSNHSPSGMSANSPPLRPTHEAEAYYRCQFYGGDEAWSQRSKQLADELARQLGIRDSRTRAVVWAHNAHVGDARATEMGTVRGQRSLGQLTRERFGEAARLIGMGAYAGSMADCDAPDGAFRSRPLRLAAAGSYEDLCHQTGADRFLLDLRPGVHSSLRKALSPLRAERFIGPRESTETDPLSDYAECRLPEQFDAWVWFDEVSAAAPR